MRRILFWVAILFSVAALGFAAKTFFWGQGLRREFERERVTPLTSVACDLSKAGEYDIAVTVTYPYGHGFKFIVDGPAVTPGRYEPEPWLDGLEGTAAVVSGPFVSDGSMPIGGYHSFASGSDSRAIVRVWGSEPGAYVLRLVVTKGAAGLAGVPHKLVIYNDVCGCELLAVFWGNALAGVIGIAGGVVGVIAVGTWIGKKATGKKIEA